MWGHPYLSILVLIHSAFLARQTIACSRLTYSITCPFSPFNPHSQTVNHLFYSHVELKALQLLTDVEGNPIHSLPPPVLPKELYPTIPTLQS